jgi:lysophospholipase L1-like esterase
MSTRKGLAALAWLCLAACVQFAGCSGAQRQPRDILYLAVGASDALGIGATPLRNGYVYRIREELQQQGRGDIRLLNLAIPGGATRDLRQALQLALRKEVKADLVTIWTGANDIIDGVAPEDFDRELNAILRELRAKSPAFIVIADIPDLARIPRFRTQPSPVVTPARIAAFNRIIDRQANEFDVPIVRLSREPITDELVSDIDGFHPSNEGHRLIAQLFLRTILPNMVT